MNSKLPEDRDTCNRHTEPEGTASDTHDPSVLMNDASSATDAVSPTPDMVDKTLLPVVRMQHLVLFANANLASLEDLANEYPGGLDSSGMLTELNAMRDRLSALFRELWHEMDRQYGLCCCATCDQR